MAANPDPLILLPPSEGKRPGGRGAWDPARGLPGLEGPRREVAAALAAAMEDPATAGSVTGLSPARREEAVAANRSTIGGPVLRAFERYDGVVWTHLEPPTLSPDARKRARRIHVVSALGGLFRYDDPVPDYKLKVGYSLPPLGPLGRFWIEPVSGALAGAAGTRRVWDLLTTEHRRAVDLRVIAPKRLTVVDFRTADDRGAAGHGAKAAKGRFARHLLDSAGDALSTVEEFEWEGWKVRVEDPGLVLVLAP